MSHEHIERRVGCVEGWWWGGVSRWVVWLVVEWWVVGETGWAVVQGNYAGGEVGWMCGCME